MSILDPKPVTEARHDQATADAINGTGPTRTALNATYGRVVVPSGLVGGQDCTTAIQAAATKAQTDGVPLLLPRAANGLPYKMSAILQAWTGARIIGQGAVLDFLTDGSATGRGLFIGSATGAGGVSDVQIHGVKFICSNAVARNGVYGLVSAFDSTDFLIEECWFGNSTAKSGGESAGVFTQNCTDFRIIRPKVQNTLADGIHISRASQRFVVDHPLCVGCGDDGVGVVSNRQDGTGPIYEPCRFGQIIAPMILNSTPIGNGVALVGAQDMDVTGIVVDGLPNAALVVAQANYGGVINAARNTIKGVTATNCTFASGTVRITDSPGTVVTGLNVTACKAGAQLINSPGCIISGGIVATTGGDYGVYADTNSTRALVTGLNLAANGATGYKVYRGTAAGAENVLVATLGTVTTYTDTGAAGTAATVPTSNTSTLGSAPAVTLGTTASSGGTFAAGTYYWKVTAITSNGETVGSNEVTATLAVNGTQTLNWGAIINAILLQGANSLETGNIKS